MLLTTDYYQLRWAFIILISLFDSATVLSLIRTLVPNTGQTLLILNFFDVQIRRVLESAQSISIARCAPAYRHGPPFPISVLVQLVRR